MRLIALPALLLTAAPLVLAAAPQAPSAPAAEVTFSTGPAPRENSPQCGQVIEAYSTSLTGALGLPMR